MSESTYPAIRPTVVAALTESAPSRVRRKVDKDPELASKWEWTFNEATVQVLAGEQTVEMRLTHGQISTEGDVTCTCLLGPRCLHVLASIMLLPIADDSSVSEATEEVDSEEAAVESDVAELSCRARESAEQLLDACADLIAAGARSAGTLVQAQLLRAIHDCRSEGLHRAATSGLRVLESVRLLRGASSQFRSDEFVADLLELYIAGWKAHQSDSISMEWLGTARRRYSPMSSLRVYGLFSEPILTRTGYGGVVTYLIDDDGRCWSLANVRPDTGGRAFQAWKASIDVGDSSATHREVVRSGLLLQKASCSTDGRLGSGKECRVVTAAGTSWTDGPIGERFERTFSDQISAVYASLERAPLYRRPDWDLLFVEVDLVAATEDGVVVRTTDGSIVLHFGIANRANRLKFAANMDVLKRAIGTRLRVISRVDVHRSGSAKVLAIGRCPNDDQTAWPDEWGDRVQFGLETLLGRHFSNYDKSPIRTHVHPSADNAMELLLRNVRAMAIGGRHSMPRGRVNSVASEARRLRSMFLPTAAMLLENLASRAMATTQDIEGIRFPANGRQLAQTWAAAALYWRASTQTMNRSDWLELAAKEVE